MITQLDPRIIEVLKGNDRNKRVYITSRSLVYHAIYYHPEFFDYAIAPFQFDLYDDFEALVRGELKEGAWVAFRESAKTSIAKIGLEWVIVNAFKKFVNVDSYDKDNSEAVLYDLATWLQTNKRLIADYGQLFYRDSASGQTAQMKRIAQFITENDVMVKAYSTQESTRGRLVGKVRPDFYLFDDFETVKTKDSYPVTAKIKAHIEEARAGLGVNGAALYLGNLIVEDGSVAQLIQDLEPRDNAIVRNIPVADPQTGEIAWPDKYVETKAEAARLNASIENPLKRFVSLEAKREELKANFEPEMMNNPSKSGDYIFDRQVIERLIAAAKPAAREVAGMKVWADFNPKHRYASGTDTSEGTGLDASAHAIIDLTRIPALVVTTWKDDRTPPDLLAFEIKRQNELYSLPYEGTEINNTGWATITQLKNIYPLERIYQRREKDKMKKEEVNELGWRTTGQTKPDIIYQLKSAVEEGTLEILDKDLLAELKYYARRDLKAMKHEEGMTRHFDLLMAIAIAWEMRNYAPLPKAELLAKVPAQPAYEPSSLYESAGTPQKRRAAGEPIIFEPEKKKPEGNDWPSMLDELTENGGSSFGDYPGGNTPGRGIY